MPSNYTPNYQLSQWSKDDRVLMDDFNADNLKLDGAIAAEAGARAAGDAALQTAVNAKASTAALNTLTQTVSGLSSGKADVSALNALTQTVNAKAEIIIGTYNGNGAAQREITLGRKPKAVLLFLKSGAVTYDGYHYGGLALQDTPVIYNKEPVLTLTETGFTVYHKSLSSNSAVRSNEGGSVLHYIAFV